jgi:glycosyltransferase involved in cell wall biosynthesis
VNRTRQLCMVVHGPYPENRVAAEALAAIDAGWSVDVVAMRRPGERAEEITDGVRIYRLPMWRMRATGLLAAAREYVGFTLLATARIAALFRRRRYAIVHVHNPPDFLILASIVPKALGARVIFDIHDFAPELFSMRFSSKRGAEPAVRVLRLVERLVTGFADGVVTVHEPYRRALTTRGVPADKITIVLNSLDERLVPNEQQAPAVDDTFRVVYHGTITPHYGVELLVEAAARLASAEPTLQVDIYGDGDALENVRARARELGISDRVYTSGRFLPQDEVLRRVRGSRAGVVSNLPIARNADAMPTKLFEYAFLGVPIVTADLPAIREHFSTEEVLFFAPGRADALADALREVAADRHAAEARAEAARRRYDEYRWDKSAARYIELLERLERPSPSKER